MELVEIRELEGPNLFLLEPAIKIEVHTDSRYTISGAPHLYAPTSQAPEDVLELADAVREALLIAGEPDCPVTIVPMETVGNFSIVFPWTDRRIARAVAGVARTILLGNAVDFGAISETVQSLRKTDPGDDDRPVMIHDEQRTALTIAVTGTNGKTTTTRLLSHIFMHAGQNVGWSSSSGVYINGEEVLSGDYSGPRGAERVLTDPEVDIAITETARGGILLRGVVCQSVDVSVFTNISADHLDLQGVRTVEGLAWAKGVITRITHPDGYAVLNASDPLILDATKAIAAQRFLVSRDPEAPALVAHGSSGGLAMTVRDGVMILIETGIPTPVLRIDEIPITSGGAAAFMVENSLFAAAAALACGATLTQVREGLASFENTPDMNPGRLNIFERDGVRVIVDFAHNEAGLVALLQFAQALRMQPGRVIAIIGTAGDRNDASLLEIGRLSTFDSDYVIAKNTTHYLRGRTQEELMGFYVRGIESGRMVPYETSENELTAVERALEIAVPGDVIAVMAHEYYREISLLFAE